MSKRNHSNHWLFAAFTSSGSYHMYHSWTCKIVRADAWMIIMTGESCSKNQTNIDFSVNPPIKDNCTIFNANVLNTHYTPSRPTLATREPQHNVCIKHLLLVTLPISISNVRWLESCVFSVTAFHSTWHECSIETAIIVISFTVILQYRKLFHHYMLHCFCLPRGTSLQSPFVFSRVVYSGSQ